MDRPWLALGLLVLLAPPVPVAPGLPTDRELDGPDLPPERAPVARRAQVPAAAATALLSPGFIENAGQLADGSIRFHTTGKLSAAFSDLGVVFWLNGPECAASYTMRFAGASPVRPAGTGPLECTSNFLVGSDPSKWRTGVLSYEGLLYSGLYPGVDLRFLYCGGGLKYEFVVAPGADPSAVGLEFAGAEPSVRGDTLVLETPAGAVRDAGFAVFQEAGPGRAAVAARMVREGGRITYDIGPYDSSRPLVIDPLISTAVLGGGGDDYAVSTAVDRFNNGYLAGETLSADFPATAGAYANRSAGPDSTFDVFVSKLAPDGKRTLFSTYIGSSGNDFVHDLRVDDAGFVYLTGYTYGFDFPTTGGAFDRSYNGYGDAFALKLSPAGSRLQFSTFLGGDDVDFGYALAPGEDGSLFVAGGTVSIDFPVTAGALQTSIKAGASSQDGFVLKLSADGSALRYCTYLGGTGMDYVLAVQCDDGGRAFVTGATASGDFPVTADAFQDRASGQDAFLACLGPDGASLDFATFFGGHGTDVGNVLVLDGSGGCLIAGDTTSYNLPATSHPAAGGYCAYWDCFAAHFDPTGGNLTFCGYFGGTGDESAAALLLDDGGNLTIAGTTTSPNLAATPAAEQGALAGGRDLFSVRLDPMRRHVLHQGYFGGRGDDVCAGAALDAAGMLCLAGTTSSAVLPGQAGNASNGTGVFLARLAPVCVPGPPAVRLSTGNHTAALDWDEPDMGAGSVEGYVLYRGRSASALNVTCRLPAGVRAYQDTGLDNGVLYYYEVSAVNASGEGERSALWTAMPGLRPSPPRNLLAAGRPSRVVLSWEPPEHAYEMPVLKYRLFRWTAGNPPRLAAELQNATAYNDTSIYNDFTYFYEVLAVNIIGESDPSGEASAIPSHRPSPPANVRSYLDGRDATLSWDLPDNIGAGSITDYLVYHELDDGRRRLAGRTPVMLFVDRDLLAGTYRYAVTANSTAGEGYPAAGIEVRITNLLPLAGYTVDRLEGTTGQPFAFTSTSYDRDTRLVNYTWDFGDGARSFKQDPTHYFARRGVYNITLRVRDLDGASAEAGGMVSVLNTAPVIGPSAPGASTVVYRGRSREFSITPLDPDTDTLKTTWTMNGSLAGEGHRVRITFNRTGSYVLTATVSDGEATASRSWNVEVEPAPPPAPARFPLNWLLGAAWAAAAATSGLLLYRRRAAGAGAAPAPTPPPARRKPSGPARRGARPVKRASQKDIIRKRYS
jgi:hypothetical protein